MLSENSPESVSPKTSDEVKKVCFVLKASVNITGFVRIESTKRKNVTSSKKSRVLKMFYVKSLIFFLSV